MSVAIEQGPSVIHTTTATAFRITLNTVDDRFLYRRGRPKRRLTSAAVNLWFQARGSAGLAFAAEGA